MRKILLPVLLVVVMVVGLVLWLTPDAAPHANTPNHPTTAQPTAAPTTRSTASHLVSLKLTTPGAQLEVGAEATFTVPAAAGETLYFNATMSALDELAPENAAALIATVPAAHGYDRVFTMPITVTYLGQTSSADGASPVHLQRNTLSGFAIATRAGADPLPNSSALDTPGCPSQPDLAALRPGDSASWCLHAFAKSASADQPIGGTFTAAAGDYRSSLTWLSKRSTSAIVIP